MLPTNPDGMMDAMATATQAAPLAYGVLTLECDGGAASKELEAAPREMLLALKKHTVGAYAP